MVSVKCCLILHCMIKQQNSDAARACFVHHTTDNLPCARRLEQQLNLLEGFQAALQVAPRVHHCGGAGHNWVPARRDLPAMVSYLAASRFGPALLSSTMRQAMPLRRLFYI